MSLKLDKNLEPIQGTEKKTPFRVGSPLTLINGYGSFNYTKDLNEGKPTTKTYFITSLKASVYYNGIAYNNPSDIKIVNVMFDNVMSDLGAYTVGEIDFIKEFGEPVRTKGQLSMMVNKESTTVVDVLLTVRGYWIEDSESKTIIPAGPPGAGEPPK